MDKSRPSSIYVLWSLDNEGFRDLISLHWEITGAQAGTDDWEENDFGWESKANGLCITEEEIQ